MCVGGVCVCLFFLGLFVFVLICYSCVIYVPVCIIYVVFIFKFCWLICFIS